MLSLALMVLALCCACATNAMKPRGVVPLPTPKKAIANAPAFAQTKTPEAPPASSRIGAAKPPRLVPTPPPALTEKLAEKTPASPVSERTTPVLPDFVERRVLAVQSSVEEKQRAAEAFVADVRALPVRISNKVNETIEQVTNVVQIPGRVVRRTQERVNEVTKTVEKLKAGQFGAALGLGVSTKKSDPYISRPDLGVVSDDKGRGKGKGKGTGKKMLNPLEVYEGVKESLYLIADGVEGTGKAIVAVGEGIASVVRAAGDLPNAVERTSASAARSLDAVVADIEGAKALASATGEQIVRIVTLEDARERVAGAKASLQDTQRKIKGAVETVTDLSEKIQGKRPFFPPPPPKPKSTFQQVFSAALKTVGRVASGVTWLLAKKEVKKEEAPPTPNPPVSSIISAVALTTPTGPVALGVPEAPRPAASVSLSSQEVIVEMPSGKLPESPTRRSFSPYKSVKDQKIKEDESVKDQK